jgi:hypothetical protein
MPSFFASLSICASYAAQTCIAPSPRTWPEGGLLVRTAQPSMKALGTTYGPQAKDTAAASASDEVSAYAPASSRICASTFTSLPSASAWWR